MLAFLSVFCSILVNSQLHLTTSIPLKRKTTHSFVRLRGVENLSRQMLIYNQSLHTTPEFSQSLLPSPLSVILIMFAQQTLKGIRCNEKCKKIPETTKTLQSLLEFHFRTCGKLTEIKCCPRRAMDDVVYQIICISTCSI